MNELHVIFAGSVQGVGFRMAAKREAETLGIKGFVRNLPDGTVEMVAQGEQKAVDLLIGTLKKRFNSSRIVSLSYRAAEKAHSNFSVS